MFIKLIINMVYIQETEEYLKFIESDEYKAYLQEIKQYKDIISYNKFLDMKSLYLIIEY